VIALNAQVLLQANLTVDYPNKPRVLRDVAITIHGGEILGLVGESGSGKSTLAFSILRLLDCARARVTGTTLLDGTDIMSLPEREMRKVRGRQLALIPQSASSSLNPALRVGTHLREAWKAHCNSSWSAEIPRVAELLRSCGLPDDDSFLRRYPNQISVGQAQRVLIVMALLHKPALLIADEPTSALDIVTQREVLELLRQINVGQGMGILFVSHDLGAVAALCHRIAILHGGRIVESGPVRDVIASPSHAYTRSLVSAVLSSQLSQVFGRAEIGAKPDRQ
jgi:ABC-type glutathione transport system ATPase component